MGYGTYYRLLFRTAFRHSLDHTQTALFILFILFGCTTWLAKRLAPRYASMIPDVSGWEIAALVLGAVVAVRLLLAPYWVWKEQNELIAASEQRKDRKAIGDKLGEFLQEGNSLAARCGLENLPAPAAEYAAWNNSITQFLTENFGPGHVGRFMSAAGLPMQGTMIVSEPHRRIWARVLVGNARLSEFLSELAD